MKKFVLILLAVLSFLEGRLGYTAIAETMHSTEQSIENALAKTLFPSDAFLLQRKTTLTTNIPQSEYLLIGQWGQVLWQFDENTGILTFISGGNLGNYATSPWNRETGSKILPTKIKKIIFTKPVQAPVDSYYLFSGYSNQLSNLIYIDGLNLLNVNNARTMYAMFYKASALTSLDLSHFDTSQVTNMDFMFSNVSSLTTLDLSHFNTSKVTSMNAMFSNVSNLTHLTLGSKSKFNRSVDLPDIPKNGYTGNWVNQADPSINMGTSDQFMDAYDGSHPGTYVWELGKVDIQSIDPISFGTQTIKEKNSATTRSTITIKDTLPQRTTQRWKLMVRYDSTDAQTKQWLAAQLKLSFSPHSDQPFLNLPTTLTVGEENQQIAELPDESKKGTQINQSIALNPQLQASGRILVGMYRAQLLWDLEATPTT